jgi:hypothetical protein
LKCKKCTERFMTFEKLDDHVMVKHTLKCGICQESFLFKRDLNKHLKTLHEITSLPPSASTAKMTTYM